MFLNVSLLSNIFSFPLRNQVPVRRKVGQNIDLHSILDQAGIGCPISLMQSMSALVGEKFPNFTKGDYLIQHIESIIVTRPPLITMLEKVLFNTYN